MPGLAVNRVNLRKATSRSSIRSWECQAAVSTFELPSQRNIDRPISAATRDKLPPSPLSKN